MRLRLVVAQALLPVQADRRGGCAPGRQNPWPPRVIACLRSIGTGRSACSTVALGLLLLVAPALRAETVVLRNGLRITITGYEVIGEKYRLQLSGGFVEVPVAEVETIEPQLLFESEPKKAEPAAAGPYHEFVQAAAAKYGVDADLITSVMATESNFDPKAISRRNARGLMQLMPQTAAQLGVRNIFDPKENIDGGTHYLRDLLQRYNNDLILALAAYNAGPERVVARVPAIRETRNYVVRVKRNMDQRKSGQSRAEQGQTPPRKTSVATPASGPATATSDKPPATASSTNATTAQ